MEQGHQLHHRVREVLSGGGGHEPHHRVQEVLSGGGDWNTNSINLYMLISSLKSDEVYEDE